MGISVKDIVEGRKTFFITPDLSLFPESYLEDFFAQGFECYFVGYDKRIPLETKIEIILNTFPDVILFFNIDYNLQDIDWYKLIKKIIQKYNNQSNIGVMFVKHQSKDYRIELEQKYLYEMGISCGCIQLEYQKKKNFDIIETILEANQAKGKRLQLRAFCTSACTFSCLYNDKPFSGILQDISLSHFSFLIPTETGFEIETSEKIKDFHISLKGVMFRSDAILLTKRPIGNQTLYVFVFVSSTTGAGGLEQRTKQLLIPNIYRLMASNFQNLLQQIYDQSKEEAKEVEKAEKEAEKAAREAEENSKKAKNPYEENPFDNLDEKIEQQSAYPDPFASIDITANTSQPLPSEPEINGQPAQNMEQTQQDQDQPPKKIVLPKIDNDPFKENGPIIDVEEFKL